MKINFVDIIFGLAWGDEGKGKISNAIADQYDMVCRWNGGPNAGHTVYLNDKKYKTHIIPCGVFQNKPSIIEDGLKADFMVEGGDVWEVADGGDTYGKYTRDFFRSM
jgi:adenylosuccinate synthase